MIKEWNEIEAAHARKLFHHYETTGCFRINGKDYKESDLKCVTGYEEGDFEEDLDACKEYLYMLSEGGFVKVFWEMSELTIELLSDEEALQWAQENDEDETLTLEDLYTSGGSQNKNPFFEARVDKWLHDPSSDVVLSNEIRCGEHHELKQLQDVLDGDFPLIIGEKMEGSLNRKPAPKNKFRFLDQREIDIRNEIDATVDLLEKYKLQVKYLSFHMEYIAYVLDNRVDGGAYFNYNYEILDNLLRQAPLLFDLSTLNQIKDITGRYNMKQYPRSLIDDAYVAEQILREYYESLIVGKEYKQVDETDRLISIMKKYVKDDDSFSVGSLGGITYYWKAFGLIERCTIKNRVYFKRTK